MIGVMTLAIRSLWHRRLATAMTVVAISLSVALFVGVNKTREATRDAFGGAISRVDLIVGPRTGTLSLLLYSVFHVGSPTHNISMKAVQYAASKPQVEWVVPFSLGDGFRGYPVLGTTQEFFARYKFRDAETIRFIDGKAFAGDAEAVIGSDVAQSLGLKLTDKIVLSHGHTEYGDGFEKHDDHPFTVIGITATTGTPIDRTIFVSLVGLGEIHRGIGESIGSNKAREAEDDHNHNQDMAQEAHADHDEHAHGSFAEKDGQIVVTSVSGFFLGAKNRMESLNLQSDLNTWKDEALLAILPGVAMAELWKNLSIFETAMSVVSFSVVITGVLGLFVSLLILSGQRQREMMVLRAVGAGPKTIFMLLAGEAVCLVFAGIALGLGVMYGAMWVLGPWIEKKFAVTIALSGVGTYDLMFSAGLLLVGALVGVLASVTAYRAAMYDGLAPKF